MQLINSIELEHYRVTVILRCTNAYHVTDDLKNRSDNYKI